MNLGSLLTVIAVICFALAAVGVDVGSISLVPAGLFFWALGTLVGGIKTNA